MFTEWVIPTRTILRTGSGPEAPTPVEPSTVATAAAEQFVVPYQDLFGQEVFRFFPQIGAAFAVTSGERRDDTGRCSAAGDDTVDTDHRHELEITEFLASRYDEGNPTETEAADIASVDPAYVIADIASKRMILDHLREELSDARKYEDSDSIEQIMWMLWMLTAPFTAHSDYQLIAGSLQLGVETMDQVADDAVVQQAALLVDIESGFFGQLVDPSDRLINCV